MTKVTKKGYIIDIGMQSKDRKRIKLYLTKKRALETGCSPECILPAALVYIKP